MSRLHYSERRITVNDITLGTLIGRPISGQSRRTLVLLHGFTGSSTSWGSLFEEIAIPDMQIVALDMPGHGQSDTPLDPRRYSIEHCEADIIAALRELDVNTDEAILLGYSMGGRIALHAAFSGFFRALILESASPGLADPTEREQRRLSDNALAATIERDGVTAFVDYWERLPLFASQQQLPEDRRRALRTQRLSNREHGLANSLRGVGTGVQPALHNRLPTLKLPVLVIAGELDKKYCTIAHQMARAIPASRLSIVPNASHTVHLEQPELFAALVKNFCQSVLL